MAPLTVSNVSTANNKEQGGAGEAVVEAGRVTETTPRTTPRGPVSPALENGKLDIEVCSDAILKVVAVPIVVPAALRNTTLPSQEAAVPAVDAVAMLERLIRAVSVVPNPMGGKVVTRVVAVVVCPMAATAERLAMARIVKYLLVKTGSSFFELGRILSVTTRDEANLLRVAAVGIAFTLFTIT